MFAGTFDGVQECDVSDADRVADGGIGLHTAGNAAGYSNSG